MYEKLWGENKASALFYTLKFENYGPLDQDNSQTPSYESQWSFIIQLYYLNYP